MSALSEALYKLRTAAANRTAAAELVTYARLQRGSTEQVDRALERADRALVHAAFALVDSVRVLSPEQATALREVHQYLVATWRADSERRPVPGPWVSVVAHFITQDSDAKRLGLDDPREGERDVAEELQLERGRSAR